MAAVVSNGAGVGGVRNVDAGSVRSVGVARGMGPGFGRRVMLCGRMLSGRPGGMLCTRSGSLIGLRLRRDEEKGCGDEKYRPPRLPLHPKQPADNLHLRLCLPEYDEMVPVSGRKTGLTKKLQQLNRMRRPGRAAGSGGLIAWRGRKRRLSLTVLENPGYSPRQPRRLTNKMNRDVDLLQGTLDMLVLKAVSLGPLHGYGVLLRIQQISEDRLEIQQGSLYPALYRLEHEGWIAGEWGQSENKRRARFYRLTAAGRRRLDAEAKKWNQFADVVGTILKTQPEQV